VIRSPQRAQRLAGADVVQAVSALVRYEEARRRDLVLERIVLPGPAVVMLDAGRQLIAEAPQLQDLVDVMREGDEDLTLDLERLRTGDIGEDLAGSSKFATIARSSGKT
jgi:hypothetical protein